MNDGGHQSLQLVAESADQQAERGRFDDLLDLVGDRLAETDVRAEAWR